MNRSTQLRPNLLGTRRVWSLALAAMLPVIFVGCSPYQLRGLVIEGAEPGIEVVGKNDPRLREPGAGGLASVDIEVRLDPTRFSPKVIGRGQSGRDGHFAVSIDEPGAGFLILDVEVQARRERFLSEAKRFNLPGGNKRLLVTMMPGDDVVPLENPNILEETLRDAEPFMRNSPN